MSRRVSISEAAFTEQVIDLARWRGWKVAHFRPAWSERGWRTPVQGDVGFPDLVLARQGRVIFVELKTERGRVSAAQRVWQGAIGDNFYVWRPSDLPQIEEVLR